MNVGRAIREAREERGWSQNTLSHNAGVFLATLGSAERGTRNVSLQTLMAICDGLGVKVSELMRRAEQYDD